MNISPNTNPLRKEPISWVCVIVWLGAIPLGGGLVVWGVASLVKAIPWN